MGSDSIKGMGCLEEGTKMSKIDYGDGCTTLDKPPNCVL